VNEYHLHFYCVLYLIIFEPRYCILPSYVRCCCCFLVLYILIFLHLFLVFYI